MHGLSCSSTVPLVCIFIDLGGDVSTDAVIDHHAKKDNANNINNNNNNMRIKMLITPTEIPE